MKRYILSFIGFITFLFGLFIVLGLISTHTLNELRPSLYGFTAGVCFTITFCIVLFDRLKKKVAAQNTFWSDIVKKVRDEKR